MESWAELFMIGDIIQDTCEFDECETSTNSRNSRDKKQQKLDKVRVIEL
jgi:hypothetical protein